MEKLRGLLNSTQNAFVCAKATPIVVAVTVRAFLHYSLLDHCGSTFSILLSALDQGAKHAGSAGECLPAGALLTLDHCWLVDTCPNFSPRWWWWVGRGDNSKKCSVHSSKRSSGRLGPSSHSGNPLLTMQFYVPSISFFTFALPSLVFPGFACQINYVHLDYLKVCFW